LTVFAIYLEWVVLRAFRPYVAAEDCDSVAAEVRKEIANRNWYSADLYGSLSPSVRRSLDTMKGGRYFNLLLPMTHAIMGANSVGHSIQLSNDPKFHLYTIAVWEAMTDRIAEICTEGKARGGQAPATGGQSPTPDEALKTLTEQMEKADGPRPMPHGGIAGTRRSSRSAGCLGILLLVIGVFCLSRW
jgi:hypothetical protein